MTTDIREWTLYRKMKEKEIEGKENNMKAFIYKENGKLPLSPTIPKPNQ